MQTFDAVDLFAGPGGWDVAAHDLGLNVLGIEWDRAACETRRAARLPTVEGDVRDYGPADFPARGFIASPPCQTFSMAGNGSGRQALDVVLSLAKLLAAREEIDPSAFEDERTSLVLEPLRWALAAIDLGTPYEWLAFEQVPTVLPVWEAFAEHLRAEGYSVVTGRLSAEQYGVPQTRKRAILVARLHGEAVLPEPTHRAYRKGVPQHEGGPALLPWVSMAEALGWGRSLAPSPTVCGGGAATGGAEPFGPRTRRELIAERDGSPEWVQRSNYSAPSRYVGQSAAERGRGERPASVPSFGLTSKTFEWTSDSASVRVTPTEAAILQTFPAEHPWQGTRTKVFQQIGNAVPPLLARAVLAAATGVSLPAPSTIDRTPARAAL